MPSSFLHVPLSLRTFSLYCRLYLFLSSLLLGALFGSTFRSFHVRGQCARISTHNLSTAQRYNSTLPGSILVEIAAENC